MPSHRRRSENQVFHLLLFAKVPLIQQATIMKSFGLGAVLELLAWGPRSGAWIEESFRRILDKTGEQ